MRLHPCLALPSTNLHSVQARIHTLSASQLAQELQELQLSQEGTQQELQQRLSRALNAEAILKEVNTAGVHQVATKFKCSHPSCYGDHCIHINVALAGASACAS